MVRRHKSTAIIIIIFNVVVKVMAQWGGMLRVIKSNKLFACCFSHIHSIKFNKTHADVCPEAATILFHLSFSAFFWFCYFFFGACWDMKGGRLGGRYDS